MIFGLQVIATLFALVMLYIAYLHYRKGDINGLEILFWLIAWIAAILIVIFPELFSVFSKTVAISRAFDLAVVGGFILVIPIVYMSYVRTKRLEKKLEDLVRSMAVNQEKGLPGGKKIRK